ncbi:phosphatidylglycerol:prolipoprotein diacylglycerol transferase [Caminicella sporogenes DSM 14501]|uniref:Phosphatidylglycerol--prolipoprotein diacylglyceryl transferase n=1 Tax=Caminicella sporogenes DSM 14501 TaxID=1121266 RepID=A0A1M6L0K2_9FIRM|nr:prolipoprotein diacylglyceryl transferase [Caminicella sporogenes]RKD27662.1 prolipoprotein diacylglyceryl transferase [Caminicella sporogenes]WIF94762.1 prolipoprotein diacylglyceryl transferase [Caminicella sporogenes]SHJ64654.1 phosphatidylglycerol:prolipoprotein diacylglycerol transferase [Caminicella sporogenes DSM 14501]
MNPVAFKIFGISVRWYGILISFGMLLGTLLAVRESRRVNIDENKLIDLILVVIPCAIIGARLYYVIFNWSYYNGDIMKIINIREGGLAIHGGVIAGFISGYLFTKYNKLSFWKIADIIAPSLILGQSIGRWGNFINKEAYGRPTNLPWAITVDGVKVHPTFLYESLWDFAIFIFLMKYRKNKKFDGEVFYFYIILYSIGRFFIEGLRIDSLMLGPFRVAQLLSLALIVIFTYLLIKRRKKENL